MDFQSNEIQSISKKVQGWLLLPPSSPSGVL
jgi:hypothetical protein